METITIKTKDGEINLNIHNQEEIDIMKKDLEDTLDLTNLVDYD